MKAVVAHEPGKVTLGRSLNPADDVISTVVPIEETPEMLQQWSSNPTAFSKIIVR
jgi:hypothetical protein